MNPMTLFVSMMLLFFPYIAACMYQKSTPSNTIAERSGTVEIYVVSTAGIPLDGAMKAVLLDANGRVWAESRERMISNVPYGSYKLSVVKEGYYTASLQLTVDRPRVWVTAGLALGAHYGETVLQGTVIRKAVDAPVWVKLVSLYTDFTISTGVDESGQFRIEVPYVKTGKALLLTFYGADLHDMRVIHIVNGKSNAGIVIQ